MEVARGFLPNLVASMRLQAHVHAGQQQVAVQAAFAPGLCVGWWINMIAAAWHSPLRRNNGWIGQVAGRWQSAQEASLKKQLSCEVSDYSALEAVPQEAAAKILESNWIALAILSLHGQVRMVWSEVKEDLSRSTRQWYCFLFLHAIDEVLELILIRWIPVTMLFPSLEGCLAGFIQACWFEARARLWKSSDKGAELCLGVQ